MRITRIAFVSLLLMGITCFAQEGSKYEVFGGYAFQNMGTSSNMQGTGFPTRLNGHGWLGTAAVNVNPVLGLKADFGGSYSTMKWDSSALGLNLGTLDAMNFSSHSFLFGPQINMRTPGKYKPWADFLVGASRGKLSPSDLLQQAGGQGNVPLFSITDTAFAMKVGGGVDISLSPMLSSRTEVGLFHTRFNFGGGDNQNNIRIATGLKLSF